MITYCGSCGSIPARSSAARIAIEPSSVACLSEREPPSFPNGVLTADTITERAIGLDGTNRYPYSEKSDDSCYSHLLGLALRAGREPAPALS